MTSAVESGGSTSAYTYAGTYDASGNRTMTGYTTTTDNEVTADPHFTYTYDNEGNELTKAGWTFTYDNANHLISAIEKAGSTLISSSTYQYDVFGNRIEANVWELGATSGAKYALDGWDPAKGPGVGNENWDVLADLDRTSNTLQMRYLRGDAVDQVFAEMSYAGVGYSPRWYLTDQRGTIRDTMEYNGPISETEYYDAFGSLISGGSLNGRYGWESRETDAYSGLIYSRAREYDPTTGRWLSQDPLGFDAGDSNLYRYVNNALTVGEDPSGLTDPLPRSSDPAILKTLAWSEATLQSRDWGMQSHTELKLQPGDLSSGPGYVAVEVFEETSWRRQWEDEHLIPYLNAQRDRQNLNVIQLRNRFDARQMQSFDRQYPNAVILPLLKQSTVPFWEGFGNGIEQAYLGLLQTVLEPSRLITGPANLVASLVSDPLGSLGAFFTELKRDPGGFVGGALFDLATMKVAGGIAGLAEGGVAEGLSARAPTTVRLASGTGSRVGPAFNPQQLEAILQNLERLPGQGVTVITGEQAARMLGQNANAAYMTIQGERGILILRSGATRLEVMEELIHHGQAVQAGFQIPTNVSTAVFAAQREIAAQERLLQIAQRMNWLQEEITAINQSRQHWQQQLQQALR